MNRTISAAPRGARASGGFTLIELMVSIALMTVLTGTVIFVFIQAQEIFVHLDAKVQVYQNVRYTFDQMERDIANMVKTADMEFHNDPVNKGHYDPGEEIVNPFGRYDYGPTIRQPDPYVSIDPNEKGLQHRRDELYFRTVAVVDNRVKEVLIEYALIDTDKMRPKLVRRVWDIVGVRADGSLIPRLPPIEDEMCLYVMDFRVEYFFDSKRTPEIAGRFYNAEDARAPLSGPRIDSPEIPLRALLNQPGWEAVCYYQNAARPNPPMNNKAVIQKADGFVRTEDNFDWGALEPGDTIYLYQPSDPRFPQRDFTIKRIFESAPGSNRFLMELKEELDLNSFSGDVLCNYRAAWLPSAFRITMKIKDSKAKELRTVSRVFKVLGA